MRMSRKWGWALGLAVFAAFALTAISSVSTEARPQGPADRNNSSTYNYMVEIEGVPGFYFTKIEGLTSVVEVIEYQDGEDRILRKRPGRVHYLNLVLYGEPFSPGMIYMRDWYATVISGRIERRSGSVIINDKRGVELARYNFFHAWPCKWEGPDLSGKRGETDLLERVEIALEEVVIP